MKRELLQMPKPGPRQLDFLDLLTAETPALKPEHQTSDELFLPGLPEKLIRAYYASAPGNEIETGKFGHPESSAALAGNAFGLFLESPNDLPPIPGCEHWWSQPLRLSLESTLRFPWRGGRHPCLDVLIITERAVVALESKRFEPYRERQPASFSRAYWRRVWGHQMEGYEFLRDILKDCGSLFARLDAAQLVKHAFGLRTVIRTDACLRSKVPILVYLYAEPAAWPDGREISSTDTDAHRREIDRFAKCVAGSEVLFHSVSYRKLLTGWQSSLIGRVRDHAANVIARYQI
jgi:Restriction Endonuclease associating with ARP